MEVRVSELMISMLRAKRIFFENNKDVFRLKPNDVISFSEDTNIEPYCGILSGNSIPEIGCFSYSWSYLPNQMQIGRYCSIAGGLHIPGPRHTLEYLSTSSFMYDRNFSIMYSSLEDFEHTSYNNYVHNPQKFFPKIGNDVWIGSNVALMPGISIGNGAVIAAHSVVTKNVESYAIVGGNPAKIIKFRFSEQTVERLTEFAWWRYHFADFAGFDLKNPDRFIDQILKKGLSEFTPDKIGLRELLQNS